MNDEKNSFSFKSVTSAEVLKTVHSLKNNKGLLFQSKFSRCLVDRFYHI